MRLTHPHPRPLSHAAETKRVDLQTQRACDQAAGPDATLRGPRLKQQKQTEANHPSPRPGWPGCSPRHGDGAGYVFDAAEALARPSPW